MHHLTRSRPPSGVIGFAFAWFLLAPTLAMWMMPTSAPVARLVANVGAFVKEHPDDAEGHYVLGRIHGLAFVMTTKEIDVWGRHWEKSANPDLPNIASNDNQFFPGRTRGAPPTQEELIVHLAEGVRHAREAVRLDPKPALHHLSLAFIVDTGVAMAERVDVLPASSPALSGERRKELEALVASLASSAERERAAAALRESLAEAAPLLVGLRAESEPVREAVRLLLRQHWRECAIEAYYEAFVRAIKKDMEIEEQPMRGLDTLISYEAGMSYLRLRQAQPPRTQEQKDRSAEVWKGVEQLEAKPHNRAVTPIIFSLERAAPLEELLAPGASARFDLDGDGTAELWPWVRPEAGFLVWDPLDERRVTSGIDLFGSVTWWMFFSTGYRALDALDDNRDHWLTGHELAGLSVWFDRDGDGVSASDEVTPVLGLGIAEIATQETSRVGRSPANLAGLRMADGRVLPTYDWVTGPVAPAPSLPPP